MIKLIWITDPHLVAPGREWPQGVDPVARLRACLEEIRTLHGDAERLVISGDLIQLGNPEAYYVLRSELERLAIPYRLLVGNHDDRGALRATFPELGQEGFVQFAEDLGTARLLCLDTLASDGQHHGELCAGRMQWLREQIGYADERPLLVFLHHPPFGIGVPALDRLRLLEPDELAGLLRDRRGPLHLFCGHVHRNASGLWAGHPFATLKSLHVQFDLDLTAPTLVRSNEPPGYAVVLVDDGDIVVHYRDLPDDLPGR